MRSQQERSNSLFSYVLIEERIPAVIRSEGFRKVADQAFDRLNPTLCRLNVPKIGSTEHTGDWDQARHGLFAPPHRSRKHRRPAQGKAGEGAGGGPDCFGLQGNVGPTDRRWPFTGLFLPERAAAAGDQRCAGDGGSGEEKDSLNPARESQHKEQRWQLFRNQPVTAAAVLAITFPGEVVHTKVCRNRRRWIAPWPPRSRTTLRSRRTEYWS